MPLSIRIHIRPEWVHLLPEKHLPVFLHILCRLIQFLFSMVQNLSQFLCALFICPEQTIHSAVFFLETLRRLLKALHIILI